MTLEIKNKLLCQHLLDKEKNFANSVYLRQPSQGIWRELTWAEVMRQARQVATVLKNAGLERGDCVSIFSKNCAEWIIVDFGISLAGMVNVPLFSNQNKGTIEFIIEKAEVKLVFIGKLDAHSRTRDYIPKQIKTINLPYHLDLETTYCWEDVLSCTPMLTIDLPKPEDTYTIIFSSGTTGEPKGVVFTHEAVANYLAILIEDLKRNVSFDRHHLLSYLPLAHVYERTSVQLASLMLDCDVAFVENLEKFTKNLQEIQPTLFTAVPRIWGVFKQRIEQQLAKKRLGILLNVPVVSYFIKKKIKSQLGLSRCQLCVSGAAHLPTSVLGFFKKIGITIQEGSGQTEDFGYTTLTKKNDVKSGFVGAPRFGVLSKRSESGELLIYSSCLMKEYYKDESLTRDSFTADGWLKTGDLVEIDEKNRIKILGRLSENFKNQKGEFVAPSLIEDQFTTTHLIEQCCLVGKMLPSNVLLVNLPPAAHAPSQIEVSESLRKLQHTVNRKLKSHEKISHILVVKENWTIANHCLTPTMKVRRRIIESNYQDLILNTVTEPVGIVWE